MIDVRLFRLLALFAALLLVVAACGGGRDDDDGAGGGTTAPEQEDGEETDDTETDDTIVDASRCQGDVNTGVTDDTIKIGVSHPQSGIAASFGQIAEGYRAYFEYINEEQGGIDGRRIELLTKDDGYETGRTVQNVNELLQSESVFALFNIVGTPNNLAVWDQLEQQCVPNLLAATGAQSLVDPEGHPFTLIANPGYATEAAVLAQHLNGTDPDARIAILYQNDDFGESYLGPLEAAIEGTDITLVARETYEPTDPNVNSQITTLGASGANVLFIGATGLKCPQAMDAAAVQNWEIVYLSGTCTSTLIMGLAQPQSSDGVLSVLYIKDPADPQFADDEAMMLYMEKVAQYNPAADPNEGLVAYGWTQGAMLVEILKSAESLDRVSVIEAARSLQLSEPPGLFLPGVSWAVDGVEDGFPIETMFLSRYDSANRYWVFEGEPIAFEGNTVDIVE